MSSKTLKQKDISSVVFNESPVTLSLVSGDEHKEKGEGVSLPAEGEPVQVTPVTSLSSPKIASTTGKGNHPSRCSQVQPIFIVLLVSTVIIAVGTSVPVVFYYVFVGQNAMLFQGRETTNTSVQPTRCLPAVYNGSFCRNVLQSYQNEFFGNESMNGQLFIASVVDQEATEKLAIELIFNLSNMQQISLDCEVKAMEVICLYLFGLCADNGTLHIPTTQQCMTTNDVCMSEQENSTTTQSDAINCTEIRNQSPRNNDFIECSEDFYLGEDGCRAECGRFEYWPHHIEDLYNILLIVALVIGAIICVMASNARHCIVFIYIPLQLIFWVFCHIVSLFWALKFPFHYQSYQRNGRLRYIHTGMVITGTFLPLIPALLPFSVHGFGYAIRVPPNVCLPVDGDIYVYPTALPIAIMSLTAMVLLLNIFWIVGKLKLRQRKTGRNPTLTAPEAKVLFLISLLLIGVAVGIIFLSVLQYRAIEARDLLIEYLDCESGGTVMECDRSDFEDAVYPIQGMNDLSTIVQALSPLLFLIVIVPFRETKKRLKVWCSGTK